MTCPWRRPAWQHVTRERNPLVCLDNLTSAGTLIGCWLAAAPALSRAASTTGSYCALGLGHPDAHGPWNMRPAGRSRRSAPRSSTKSKVQTEGGGADPSLVSAVREKHVVCAPPSCSCIDAMPSSRAAVAALHCTAPITCVVAPFQMLPRRTIQLREHLACSRC